MKKINKVYIVLCWHMDDVTIEDVFNNEASAIAEKEKQEARKLNYHYYDIQCWELKA